MSCQAASFPDTSTDRILPVLREYPAAGGASGNYKSPQDTANYLLFLQALRQALGASSHITTCTTHRAFIGPNGSPVTDVSTFAAVLDGVLVMNYDVWGGEYTAPDYSVFAVGR